MEYKATDAQIHFLKSRNIDATNMSKKEASDAISNIVGGNRQNSQAGHSFPYPKKTTYPSDDPNKDRLIVRQSCLKAAVKYYDSLLGLEGNKINKTVLELAEEFEKWVFR